MKTTPEELEELERKAKIASSRLTGMVMVSERVLVQIVEDLRKLERIERARWGKR